MEVVLFVGGRVSTAGAGCCFSLREEFSKGDFGEGWRRGGDFFAEESWVITDVGAAGTVGGQFSTVFLT